MEFGKYFKRGEMMTAKEMFEELGYEYKEDDLSIDYQNFDDYQQISFLKLPKVYQALEGCDGEAMGISIKLDNAIQKQIEELGWNNEG